MFQYVCSQVGLGEEGSLVESGEGDFPLHLNVGYEDSSTH